MGLEEGDSDGPDEIQGKATDWTALHSERAGAAMILQALGLKNGGNRGSTTDADSQVASPDIAVTAEMQLERDLAVALARQPKPTRSADYELYEEEDEIAFIGADQLPDEACQHTRKSRAGLPASKASEDIREPNQIASEENPSDIGEVESPTQTRERWLKSTKRSRRSMMFRKAASFAITLAVTIFIVSVAAVILFGLPAGFDKLRTATTSAKTASAVETRAVPTMAIKTNSNAATHRPVKTAASATTDTQPPPRLQWLSFQGE